MNFKAWLHSVVAAGISSAANSVVVIVLDPAKFNFSHGGLAHLGEVAALSALFGIALVLKQSPLPSEKVTVTDKTVSQTVTVAKTDASNAPN
jgi:hypothetical protein